MSQGTVEGRLATEAGQEAVTELLVAPLRGHPVEIPTAPTAEAVRRAAGLYAREGFRPLPRARWVRSLEPVLPRTAAPPAEVTGGCFCGAIRYRAEGAPREVSHCHCGICRRTSGAPFVTWATFPAACFAFTAGTPAELRSTPRAVRHFCAACGTALTFRETARPGSVDVTVGSMDRPDAIVPAAHIWTASQLAWLRLGHDLPRHPGEDPAERDVEP